MTTRKRMKEIVEQELADSGFDTLDAIEQALGPISDDWNLFWIRCSQQWVNQVEEKMSNEGLTNSYAPEETFKASWDHLEYLYPEYILKPAFLH